VQQTGYQYTRCAAQNLLAQQKVTLSDSGSGGLSAINAQKVLQHLGIAEEMKGKLLPSTDGQGLIAKGEANLGLYNLSEIPRAKGSCCSDPFPPPGKRISLTMRPCPQPTLLRPQRSSFSISSRRLRQRRDGRRQGWS
jgi:hypothetical protein